MPTSARASLSDARLYLCTDARRRQGDLPEFLDAVLAAGVDIVQLRDKGMEAGEELEHLAVLADACRRHGRLLAVNDRADVAHAAASDVLHLGQGDLPVPAARAILGGGVLIGRSTHAEAEVDAAAAEPGVDYFCTGPCWPTPTKPGRYAPGLGLVRYAASLRQDRPWFAIGGVDAGTLDEVLDAGARRIVVVRAITEADDPAAATADLARRVRERVAADAPADAPADPTADAPGRGPAAAAAR
ncbi:MULTISPECIES: thiamine phosphate synthase [Streptomyces]|uniref:Thiamine-phosphate synthase n=1 Tax=Streptomyces fradiae ATCC 10745 = DSM 40063 TaxID=1319510 RepID=A0A1Y2P351_STRFR|nr:MULTISPECIES: thiamine phosphate synthase [Streptomyces]KAF0648471.1 thiamine-phosphate pyrophosphorylase [Streptomyces fradiae ATCC 10745 = DSM 40063]OSY53637.1 Thiamine-phosphate synthase [Streptomyces fradiae ATCC 10745 = DSM 40063]